MPRLAIPLLSLMILSTTVAAAQPDPPHMQRQRVTVTAQPMLEQLNLNDQQQEQMEKLRADNHRAQVQTRSKIELARIDLRELYNAEKTDRSAIEKKLKEISDLQHQLKLNHLNHFFAVNNILTPEQQKIWKKHIGGMGDQVRERVMRRMGRGMGRYPADRQDVRIEIEEED